MERVFTLGRLFRSILSEYKRTKNFNRYCENISSTFVDFFKIRIKECKIKGKYNINDFEGDSDVRAKQYLYSCKLVVEIREDFVMWLELPDRGVNICHRYDLLKGSDFDRMLRTAVKFIERLKYL